VQAGKVAVKDDDVVGAEVNLGRGVHAVVGGIDRESLVPEPLGDVASEPAATRTQPFGSL
jgi:hypothetical protein